MKNYDADVESDMKEFSHALSERDKRRYVAIEAKKLGHGGQLYLSQILGCSTRTIQRGLVELEAKEELVQGQIRRPGGGRKGYEKKRVV